MRDALKTQVTRAFKRHYEATRNRTEAWNRTLDEVGGKFTGESSMEQRRAVGEVMGKVSRQVMTRSKSRPRHTYQIWTYDVWGNAKDGYDINDRFKQGQIELPDDPSNNEIVKILRQEGYIDRPIRRNLLEIDGESDFTLYLRYRGRPELELERIHS